MLVVFGPVMETRLKDLHGEGGRLGGQWDRRCDLE